MSYEDLSDPLYRNELEDPHPDYWAPYIRPLIDVAVIDAELARLDEIIVDLKRAGLAEIERIKEEEGMDVRTAFPGQYVKAADLGGKTIVVVIERVEMEDISGETKPVVHFRGKERGLALNKTNANMIGEVLGTYDTDRWKGQAISLYPSKTDFQGKRVDCIRVDKAPTGAPVPVPPPPPPFQAGDEDVPF